MNTIYTENKRAFYDYEFLERFEAGIVLKGFEVKAVKSGRVNLAGSYAVPKAATTRSRSSGSTGVELWLLNTDIPPYQPGNTPPDYDPKRSRRLLLKHDEIKYLLGKVRTGLTILPVKVYTKHGLVKIELALAKPKKKYDKRETIKKREAKREIARTLRE